MALSIASAVSLRADEPLTPDRKVLSVTAARAIVAVAEAEAKSRGLGVVIVVVDGSSGSTRCVRRRE